MIQREPGGYRLAGVELDTDLVERLVETADGQPPDRAAAILADALALWRGDPLAAVSDRLVFAPEIARLTEWHRHLLQEWHGLRLDAGRAAEALPEIEALATAEPLRERPQLLLTRALHASGRTPQALAVLSAYRRRLAESHGLDPSPALIEMQRRILAEDPALRPAVPPMIIRRAAGRFFGRRTELAAIREALATDRVITLVGPGGVGKTRLMT